MSLAGEHKAFTETLVELNPFAEMSDLGSAIHFTVHTAKLVECVLKVNGKQEFYDVIVEPVKNEEGKTAGITGVVVNITEKLMF